MRTVNLSELRFKFVQLATRLGIEGITNLHSFLVYCLVDSVVEQVSSKLVSIRGRYNQTLLELGYQQGR